MHMATLALLKLLEGDDSCQRWRSGTPPDVSHQCHCQQQNRTFCEDRVSMAGVDRTLATVPAHSAVPLQGEFLEILPKFTSANRRKDGVGQDLSIALHPTASTNMVQRVMQTWSLLEHLLQASHDHNLATSRMAVLVSTIAYGQDVSSLQYLWQVR